MTDKPRLIEVAFPLRQASLDSVHEKNVRHGHISTLHIWPARRPLAACRAALIATLLPDPGTEEARQKLCEKIGGTLVKKHVKKKTGTRTIVKEKGETVGGVLHWGRENSPDMDWFREEIRKAYGGRAPRVLDPFAGGGAIPLEAMRLGCEATAIDINPVAWFILKCTLEYPQKLAGQKRPLPEFILGDEEFMRDFYKSQSGVIGKGKPTKKQQDTLFKNLKDGTLDAPEADLAWHVRAWGKWVLNQARKELAKFYPTYADFEPVDPERAKPFKTREPKLVPLKEDGNLDLEALNAEFDPEYLADLTKPRWVSKPTVAYLWARTVTCNNCRATIPLLKTRWLCKKENKRVLLTMKPNADKTGVEFGVQTDVPQIGGNTAQRREHDKKIGAGTMSRTGVKCPCCPAQLTMGDVRTAGQQHQLHAVMTAVVVDGQSGKEYRSPLSHEIEMAASAEREVPVLFESIPFGLPSEPTPAGGGSGAGRAFSVQNYGLMKWSDLYSSRQLLALGVFVRATRSVRSEVMACGYAVSWSDCIAGPLALAVDRIADRGSSICHWDLGYEKIANTFSGFRLPISWDFAESSAIGNSTGSYAGQLEWVALYLTHGQQAANGVPLATQQSATRELSAGENKSQRYDFVLTDPPYYDAIPYSDLMDFFYVWLRRTLYGLSSELDAAFKEPLSPKWNHQENDGELIDDSTRHGGDAAKSKAVYEDGMARVFLRCHEALNEDGRMVVVFANKQPDAWEALVSAIIRAGFVVDGSWPIQTEMGNRTRALSSAALASSVWLVCKKRPAAARPGWDNRVLQEMREKIYDKLKAFWDAHIRGPDFVWAATGPALEAFSKHPVVKKANDPGQVMTVGEFLRHARRIVVDYVVGNVLHSSGDTGLDDVTTYYLLHRHDFGFADAPIGPCILYAVSCGLSDSELADKHDLLFRTGGKETPEDEEPGEAAEGEEPEEGSGSKVKLKQWHQRKRSSMGFDMGVDSSKARQAEEQKARDARQAKIFDAGNEYPEFRPRGVPLIDQVHRLMHLWRASDVHKVDEYIERRAIRKSEVFGRLLQALIELSDEGSDERSLLEKISNHLQARGQAPLKEQKHAFKTEVEESDEADAGPERDRV